MFQFILVALCCFLRFGIHMGQHPAWRLEHGHQILNDVNRTMGDYGITQYDQLVFTCPMGGCGCSAVAPILEKTFLHRSD